MNKSNPHYTLKKLFDSGSIEDYEEFFHGFGKTNIRDVTGMSYDKVLKTREEPDILTLRNIIKLSNRAEINPRDLTNLIFDSIEKKQKRRKK